MIKNKKGGFHNILISALLVGLVVLCIIQFGGQLALDNNSNRTILNEPSLNTSLINLSNTLGGVDEITNTQLNATSQEPATIGYGSIILFSILTAGRVFTTTITSVYSLIGNLIYTQLGIPAIVFNILLSILVITIIFYLWRTYRVGQ